MGSVSLEDTPLEPGNASDEADQADKTPKNKQKIFESIQSRSLVELNVKKMRKQEFFARLRLKRIEYLKLIKNSKAVEVDGASLSVNELRDGFLAMQRELKDCQE